MMTELQRRHTMGVPAAPADLHEGLREAYGSAARRPGPATMAVRRAIDQRQREMTQRVSGHIGETLGPVTNVEAQADALNAQAKAAAQPLYDISNAQPIPYVKELQELFRRPAGHQALQDAGVSLQNQGIRPSSVGIAEGKDGIFRLGRTPKMEAYDYAKTELDRTAFAGQQPFQAPQVTRDSRGAMDIRNRLLDLMDGDGSGPRIPQPGTDIAPQGPGGSPPAPVYTPPEDPMALPPAGPSAAAGLPMAPPGARGGLPALPDTGVGPWTGQRLEPEIDDAAEAAAGPRRARRMSQVPPEGLNPFWKPARDAYAGPVQNRKALELGQDMAKADATDASNRMGDMTGSQLDHFRLGHRTGLVDDVRGLGDYGNAARRVDGSLQKRDAISTVHGAEPTDGLFDRLAAEHEGHQTWATVRGNSMTAGRGAADQIAAQEQALAAAGKGMWAAVTSRPLDAARHFASAFSGEPALTNEVNDRVAQALGNTDLDAVRSTMGDVRRAKVAEASTADRADAAHRQAAKLIGGRTGAGMATPANRVLLGYGQGENGSTYPVFGAPGTQLGADYLPPDP